MVAKYRVMLIPYVRLNLRVNNVILYAITKRIIDMIAKKAINTMKPKMVGAPMPSNGTITALKIAKAIPIATICATNFVFS